MSSELGVDYLETFALVTKMNTVKVILSDLRKPEYLLGMDVEQSNYVLLYLKGNMHWIF